MCDKTVGLGYLNDSTLWGLNSCTPEEHLKARKLQRKGYYGAFWSHLLHCFGEYSLCVYIPYPNYKTFKVPKTIRK